MHVSVLVEDQIFRLYVPVNYIVGVDVLQAQKDASHEEPYITPSKVLV